MAMRRRRRRRRQRQVAPRLERPGTRAPFGEGVSAGNRRVATGSATTKNDEVNGWMPAPGFGAGRARNDEGTEGEREGMSTGTGKGTAGKKCAGGERRQRHRETDYRLEGSIVLDENGGC